VIHVGNDGDVAYNGAQTDGILSYSELIRLRNVPVTGNLALPLGPREYLPEAQARSQAGVSLIL